MIAFVVFAWSGRRCDFLYPKFLFGDTNHTKHKSTEEYPTMMMYIFSTCGWWSRIVFMVLGKFGGKQGGARRNQGKETKHFYRFVWYCNTRCAWLPAVFMWNFLTLSLVSSEKQKINNTHINSRTIYRYIYNTTLTWFMFSFLEHKTHLTHLFSPLQMQMQIANGQLERSKTKRTSFHQIVYASLVRSLCGRFSVANFTTRLRSDYLFFWHKKIF